MEALDVSTLAILAAATYFLPYFLLIAVVSALLGAAFLRLFRRPQGRRSTMWASALSFFAMFGLLGLVCAYFVGVAQTTSFGLSASVFTPVFSAGLAFMTSKQLPRGRELLMPAGLVCFVVVLLVGYKGFVGRDRIARLVAAQVSPQYPDAMDRP